MEAARPALGWALVLLGLACDGGRPPDPRPNVLLVTVDKLRADHLGTYGFELDTSPRIDALAARSVLFERAIAAASSTAPSHASILTSRFVREHAIGYGNGDTRLADEPTLAERFRSNGFATAAFVSNFVLRSHTGLDRGFEVYDDELPTRELNRNITERTAEATTERAIAWLDATQGPFFLWVHYQDPHGPYTPPPPLDRRFRIAPEPDERELPHLDANHGWGGIPAYQVLEGLTRPSQYRSRYAGEIFHTDRHFGRLIDRVDRHPSKRPVLILFTADHGESFGENDRWFVHRHTTTPDTARVPMLLGAPGLTPDRLSDPVSHVDVMPTLLELAGIEPPPGISGIALGPYLRSGTPLPERTLYCDVGRELSAYGSSGFVRVLGADAAYWERGPARRSPIWTHHVWTAAGRAFRSSPQALDDEVRAYIDAVRPMEAAGMPDGALQALEALGYVDDSP